MRTPAITARRRSTQALPIVHPAPARAANVGAAPYLSAMRRGLILAGLVLVVLGIAWPWLERIGLGHLPGDIRLRRPGFTLFVPLGSSLLVSIVLSVALTAILWLLRR